MFVQKGNKVEVEYVGMLEDGSVFDASEKHEGAVHIDVGSGKALPGFEQALMGMQVGEAKEFVLSPEEAYGYPDPQFKKEIPRDQFPTEQELQPGMMVGISHPNGQQFPALIVEVRGDSVVLDLNHPLAGKKLHFKVKVIAIGN